MAGIRRLWLFTETSSESFAGSNAKLRLDIQSQDGSIFSVDLGNSAGDSFARGKTSCQEVLLPQSNHVDDTQIREICLRILDGHDAWLPKSIWIISENVDGDRRLLTSDPNWHRWFDWESRPGYSLSLSQRQDVAAAATDP